MKVYGPNSIFFLQMEEQTAVENSFSIKAELTIRGTRQLSMF